MSFHLFKNDRSNFRADIDNIFREHVNFPDSVGIKREREKVYKITELFFTVVGAIIKFDVFFVEAVKDDA